MTNKIYKQDFPIFKNNPDLVFLDSWASSQKPQYVIDWVSHFTSNSYANIHRWSYDLSEQSEELYAKSKSLLWEFLNCKASEIIYTYNSTYAFNLIAQSLVHSDILQQWDTILLWIREHHANVVPRQILAEKIWFKIKFIHLIQDESRPDNYDMDREDFDSKYDETVKVVSLWHVSNVTGQIYDMKRVRSKLRNDTFFVVDWSQSFPNFPVDMQDIWCDCFILTGHKAMAYTGIWAIYLKREYVKKLTPMIWGGWAIKDVDVSWHTIPTTSEKFEVWTPNIIWAVSLLKSLEYIKSIWGMQTIWEHEQELVNYALPKFAKLSNKVKLIWSNYIKNQESSSPDFNNLNRIAVFSFYIPNHKNFNNIWEIFAEHNIAIRCGGHCAHPLHKNLEIPGTCRVSAYIYNDKLDIDKFFNVLSSIID